MTFVVYGHIFRNKKWLRGRMSHQARGSMTGRGYHKMNKHVGMISRGYHDPSNLWKWISDLWNLWTIVICELEVSIGLVPEGFVHLQLTFCSKSWPVKFYFAGRLMVQQAQSPHTELHGMDDAKVENGWWDAYDEWWWMSNPNLSVSSASLDTVFQVSI